MSSIEERLVRDIAAVTGGVVVTESDLRDARNAVDERIDRERQRDRRRTLVAAAAAAAVVAVVGVTALQTLGGDDRTAPPAGPGPDTSDAHADYLTGTAPTPQLVDGVWRVDNGEVALRFDADGTVQFDNRGRLYSQPMTTGTYEIDGDLITVTATDSAQAGCAGTEFAMRASFPDPGIMRFVYSATSFSDCSPMPNGRGALEQVLPTSPVMAGLLFSTERGWQRPSDRANLYGVWLAERGGHALEIAPGGSYVVADESGDPVDRGQWSWRGSDLTLTSSTLSAECDEGDRLVLGAVQQVDPGLGTIGMRGRVEQNACGGAWTPAAWILIPHAGD